MQVNDNVHTVEVYDVMQNKLFIQVKSGTIRNYLLDCYHTADNDNFLQELAFNEIIIKLTNYFENDIFPIHLSQLHTGNLAGPENDLSQLQQLELNYRNIPFTIHSSLAIIEQISIRLLWQQLPFYSDPDNSHAQPDGQANLLNSTVITLDNSFDFSLIVGKVIISSEEITSLQNGDILLFDEAFGNNDKVTNLCLDAGNEVAHGYIKQNILHIKLIL